METALNYLVAFPSEIQAQQLLEPFGYAHVVTPRPPGQSWDDYAWNGSNGMIGGCKIVHHWEDKAATGIDGQPTIIRAPVLTDSWFWVSLLNQAADNALWARFSGQPIIELDMTRQPGPVERPSDYVSRSAHLSFDIDAITGPITPIWAGQHGMGFRGDVR